MLEFIADLFGDLLLGSPEEISASRRLRPAIKIVYLIITSLLFYSVGFLLLLMPFLAENFDATTIFLGLIGLIIVLVQVFRVREGLKLLRQVKLEKQQDKLKAKTWKLQDPPELGLEKKSASVKNEAPKSSKPKSSSKTRQNAKK